jgi:hypothetical protein
MAATLEEEIYANLQSLREAHPDELHACWDKDTKMVYLLSEQNQLVRYPSEKPLQEMSQIEIEGLLGYLDQLSAELS